MVRLDLDLVRHALQTASKHGFAEVELSQGEDRFVAKFQPVKPAPKSQSSAHETSKEPTTKTITATSVGYYRPAKNPLQVGLEVKAGDVVAEILALGLKNDVLSKWNGIVAQVLVTPEQPVEFGQAIAVLTLEK